MDYLEKGTAAFRKANVAFFVAGFNTFAILYCTQPLLSHFSDEFRVSPTVASLSLSGTTLSLAVSMIFFSAVSERWGRKRVMFISMLMASLLSFATAFSTSFPALVGLRLLLGIALGGLPSIAMAYLGEEVAQSSLSLAMGLYISGNSLGAVVGRVLTSVCSNAYNWHIGLGIISIIGLCASLVFGRLLPESRHFQSTCERGKSSFHGFILHLKNPVLLSLFSIGFLILASNIAMYNYVGYVLESAHYGLPHSVLSWIYLFYLVGMISSVVMAKLSTRLGKSRALAGGLLITIVGAGLTLIPDLWFKLAGLPVLTFGFFGSHSIASGWVSQRASKNKAQASSLYLFFYYMGSSIGGTFAGEMWGWYGWDGVVSLIFAFLVLAGLFTWFLSRRTANESGNNRALTMR
ncbi:MFS transporter [Paenibacillus illinoisensis]|uniref:MFS transporter n=1 Tax=Paenibacillus illinoisensis TaxID=59845 RepID=UPI003CF4C975